MFIPLTLCAGAFVGHMFSSHSHTPDIQLSVHPSAPLFDHFVSFTILNVYQSVSVIYSVIYVHVSVEHMRTFGCRCFFFFFFFVFWLSVGAICLCLDVLVWLVSESTRSPFSNAYSHTHTHLRNICFSFIFLRLRRRLFAIRFRSVCIFFLFFSFSIGWHYIPKIPG